MNTRIVCLVCLLCVGGVVNAAPSADQVLTEMGFSAGEKQRVMKGEFVTSEIGAVSERDLSFAVAFLVKASPDALSKQLIDGAIFGDDGQVRAYGKLTAPGSPEDLSGLHITMEEAHALSSDKLGDEMNFSAAELAAFKSLRGDSAQSIQERLQEVLLARYQSYRASGLAGIAPYDRGGRGVADVASDLTKASRAAAAFQKYMPAVYGFLFDYPGASLPGLQESFLWVKSIIRDKPTYVLTHVVAVGDGEARAIIRREFYVSTGYNAEQSIAGFLPVAGGTVVLLMSHAFTDQVAGSGGSIKRGIGTRVMANQMKGIFETSRKRIER